MRVLLVVPKPGMVTAMMPSRGLPKRSKARTVTRSASAESSPPEMPMTAVLLCVCFRRRARALLCMERMSPQRRSSSFPSGTKGVGSTLRVSFPSASGKEKATFV